MKILKYLFFLAPMLFSVTGCKKELEKNPQGNQTEQNFFVDPDNAILAVNGIYDVASWDEGPGTAGQSASHVYEWMFGDVLSNDAEKGSTAGDFPSLTEMKEWRGDPATSPAKDAYINMYQGIFRANTVIKNLQTANWDPQMKNRLMGEAYFLRGYFYFYLVRLFGGMPVFAEPVKPSEFGIAKRATFSETCKFIEDDFNKAIQLMPLKSGYSSFDLGRATKGTAQAYLARAIMYQIGTDNTNNHTWQQVYDLTNDIVTSGQYSLTANYAQIFENEGENNPESIFEIQFKESPDGWGPIKTGTTNNVIQMSRKLWGWGFNNPTQNLATEFEANDPRKASVLYGNNDIVLGIKQQIVSPSENATGFLNRKAAIVKPIETKASPQNIRKFRYADVLLMKAEAATYIGKESEARDILNTLRARARNSSQPKGSIEGDADTYQAAVVPNGTLPDIANTVTGQALKNAVLHERRTELAMESLHFWDMIRTGTYMSSLTATIRAKAMSHSITTGVVNPIPVLPLPLTEVQQWNLEQNPNY